MRQGYDFGPLFRSTVGFDRVFDLLQNATRSEHLENYPPYDIERTGQDSYRVILAVAGFSPEELSVTSERNVLCIRGERQERSDGEGQREFLHRGIGARAFERRFQVADYVKVQSANFADGLLTIELVREIPEAMRPRRVEIARAEPTTQRRIEGDKAA